MKKIVHVITGLGVGGAETFLLRVIPEIRSLGYDSVVIYLTGKGEYVNRYEANGIRVLSLGMGSLFGVGAAIWRLFKILRRESPDLVQTWMYHANLIGGVAGFISNLPVLWAVQQSNLSKNVNKPTTRAVINICSILSRYLPQKILYDSEAARLAHEDIGFKSSKSYVIPNGVDERVFSINRVQRETFRRDLEIPTNAVVIGHIARFDVQKDHETFIRAVRLARTNVGNIYVLMVGAQVEWSNESLTQMLMPEGSEGWIRLLGSRDDVVNLFGAMDIFCLSSIGESCPNVLLEAMMMAVPCIATDVGDVKRILGPLGITVPPESPQRLSEQIELMAGLSQIDLREIGLGLRKRAKDEFTLARAAMRFGECYEPLISWERSP